MRYVFIFLFACIFITPKGIAQVDTLKLIPEPISDDKATFSEQIAKARYRLIDYLISNDTTKSIGTFHYLIQGLENEHYLALGWHEKFLFSFLMDQYRYILSEVYNLNEATIEAMKNKIWPREDQLFEVLYKKVIKNSQLITAHIENHPQLTAEEKQFLKLVLHTYTIERTPESNETINKEADAFLKEYPNSAYEGYVRNYIRYRYVMDKYIGFVMGGGVSAFTGKINNYLGAKGNILLEMSYGKTRSYHFTFSVLGNFAKVKQRFAGNDGYVFQTDSSAHITTYGLAFFYDRWYSQRFVFSPFIGIGWSDLASITHAAKSKDESISATTPWMGFECAWNFRKPNARDIYNLGLGANMALAVRYSFLPYLFGGNYSFLNGSSHTLTLCIIMQLGTFTRDY
jgi:hypothetical protein